MDDQSCTFILRQAAPHQLRGGAAPKNTLFHLRANEPTLSLFDPNVVSARTLFEQYLARVRTYPTEKQQNVFASNGQTPEEMYEKGWRIVKIERTAFSESGIALGETDPESGHIDASASAETFEDVAGYLSENSTVLSKEETLR